MFKNPIKKYQNGGSVNQNQAMQQVVEFISQVAKVSPEEVMATLDKIKGDEDAINTLSQALELAKNNDERGFQVIQSMFNPKTNTQLAKDGGKLHDFICKHAKGGYVAGCGCKEDGGKVDNKGYTAQVNAPGDTTRTKQYNYRQEIMQTYPDGSVRYTTRTTGGEPTEIHTWGPEGIPNIWRRLWFGNRQANSETVNNWRDIIANHPEDPRNVLNQEDGGIVKSEDGTRLSRREALEQSKATHGYNNAQAQTAYINAKNALRRQGLRGSALKQAAREMIARSQSQNNPIQSVDTPPVLQSTLSTPLIKPNVPEVKPINYDNMSFGEAFKIAADKADNGGPKTFMWRGKSYGTRRASNPGNIIIKDVAGDPVVIENETADVPEFEEIPVNTPTVEQVSAAELLYPGLENMTNIKWFSYPNVVNTSLQWNSLMEGSKPADIKFKTSILPIIRYSPYNYKSSVPERKQGGVVKGQKGLYEIPSEAPSTGEIRPESTTNPIRRWIDRTVDNNSALRTASHYARNFGNSAMGKVINFVIPNFENGIHGAIVPSFKIKGLEKLQKLGLEDQYNKVPEYVKDFENLKFNTNNIESIDLSNLLENPSIIKRFVNWFKSSPGGGFAIGTVTGALGEAALVKHMQNKKEKAEKEPNRTIKFLNRENK